MIKHRLSNWFLTIALLLSLPTLSKPQVIDHVSVIVNNGVILETEIQAVINNVKQGAQVSKQSLPSDQVLRTQAIDRLILQNLQLQLAERMGIQISDSHLDSAISNIAQQNNISIPQLRQSIISEGKSYERYREDLRKDIAINEVKRANVQRRVDISLQEVNSLIEIIDTQSNKEEFQIGHILISINKDSGQEEISQRRVVADKVINLLENGSDFKKIAIASSSGSKALEGGDWGYMAINEMPSLFAANIKGKKKGDLIGPLRSAAGFHIVKVLDIRGREIVEVNEVLARHILVKPSIILPEQKTKEMLSQFLLDIKSGKSDFAKLAQEHSEDPGSALKGGELGWSNPERYAPNFKEQLSMLNVGEYSKPFRTQFGWHIVQLIDKRTADATEKSKQDRAYQILFKRKFAEESANWLREIKDQAYIEILSE